MRGAVLTTAAFSLLVLGGLLWVAYVIRRDRRRLRELDDWWAKREAARERERTRGER